MDRRERHGSVVGPVIIISLGVIFLLNNLGYLDWGIWQTLLRLWPALLIGAGLDLLIGRRSAWGSLLVAVLLLAVLAGAIFLHGRLPAAGSWAGEPIRQSLDGASQAHVSIRPGIGDLTIAALEQDDLLLEARLDLARGEVLEAQPSRQGDMLRYTLASGKLESMVWGPWGSDRTWQVSLQPDIPIELVVDMGVGLAEIDASQLALSGLEASMGVGRTVIALPRQASLEAFFDGGLGEVIVRLPDDVGVRVEVRDGLSQVSTSPGFRRQGDTYFTPGYDDAEIRINLFVRMGIGLIRLETVPSR
jgi:hypothetical protein